MITTRQRALWVFSVFSTCNNPLCAKVERFIGRHRPQHHRDAQNTNPKKQQHSRSHRHAGGSSELGNTYSRRGELPTLESRCCRSLPPTTPPHRLPRRAASLSIRPSLLPPPAAAAAAAARHRHLLLLFLLLLHAERERRPPAPKCSASVRTFGSLALWN